MTRVEVYQVDAEGLLLANKSLLAALLQDVVIGVTVSAANPFYRKGWTIETEATGEAALEAAWFAAQDVATADATVIEKTETARQSTKSDLFVLSDGTAWIAQGSWFSDYAGPRPAGAEAPAKKALFAPVAA